MTSMPQRPLNRRRLLISECGIQALLHWLRNTGSPGSTAIGSRQLSGTHQIPCAKRFWPARLATLPTSVLASGARARRHTAAFLVDVRCPCFLESCSFSHSRFSMSSVSHFTAGASAILFQFAVPAQPNFQKQLDGLLDQGDDFRLVACGKPRLVPFDGPDAALGRIDSRWPGRAADMAVGSGGSGGPFCNPFDLILDLLQDVVRHARPGFGSSG